MKFNTFSRIIAFITATSCVAPIYAANVDSNELSKQLNLDKFRGSIIGAALGDALGRPTEFLNMNQIHAKYGPQGVQGFESFKPEDFINNNAVYTDDTGMSLIAIDTLMAPFNNQTEFVQNLTKNFIADIDQQHGWAAPYRAPGNACMKNLEYARHRINLRGGAYWIAVPDNDGGCGSVMRAHPYGLLFHNNLKKVEEFAVAQSLITHRDPIAQAACAAMAVGVALAYNGEHPENIAAQMYDVAKKYDVTTAAMIRKAIHYATDPYKSSNEVYDEFRGWAAHEAIAATVYTFLKSPDNLKTAILLGTNTPGDSDSIASMAGALVGARVGLSGIPEQWLLKLESYDQIKDKAESFYNQLENKSPSEDCHFSFFNTVKQFFTTHSSLKKLAIISAACGILAAGLYFFK